MAGLTPKSPAGGFPSLANGFKDLEEDLNRIVNETSSSHTNNVYNVRSWEGGEGRYRCHVDVLGGAYRSNDHQLPPAGCQHLSGDPSFPGVNVRSAPFPYCSQGSSSSTAAAPRCRQTPLHRQTWVRRSMYGSMYVYALTCRAGEQCACMLNGNIKLPARPSSHA